MKYNPTHNEVECRGYVGSHQSEQRCFGKTRAISGLCDPCRGRIYALVEDLKLAKEWEEERYE